MKFVFRLRATTEPASKVLAGTRVKQLDLSTPAVRVVAAQADIGPVSGGSVSCARAAYRQRRPALIKWNP